MKLRVVALAVALVGVGQNAWAQMDEEDLAQAYGDKEFVSIATGRQQPVRKAPSVATIITAEDMAAMGATTLDEALEAVPGLHVSYASVRYASLYTMRGIGGGGQTNPQMLILQNGIPVTTMFNGDKSSVWRATPLENIARIEVIRGPGSALYGADAYAGVINIITKTAQDTRGTELGVRAGSFNTWDTWAQHGGKIGPVDVAGFIRLGGSDGFKEAVARDAQSANDRRSGTHASLAPGSVDTGYDAIDASLDFAYDHWRLRSAYKLRDNFGIGVGGSNALVPNSDGRYETLSGDLSWNNPHLADNWAAGFSASYMQDSFRYQGNFWLYPPGTRLGTGPFPQGVVGGPNLWERQIRVSAFAAYTGIADHSLRVGVGYDDMNVYKTRTYKNYRLTAAGPAPDPVNSPTGQVVDYSNIQPFLQPHQRIVRYAYLQDEWSLAQDWTVTAGVRRDMYSDFGGTTNPRLAVVWEAAYDLTAKLLWGQAFRAPSFNEQYGINPVANGNPGLQPETIRTVEAALSWEPRKHTQVTLSVFRYHMGNIIRLTPNPAPTPGSTYQNTGSQDGNGGELEIASDITRDLRLSGYYAYQHSRDAASGTDAGYTPHHHVYLRADWKMVPGWQLHTQVNYIGDRRRVLDDNRDRVPDYATVDITLRTERPRQGWDFALSLRNLFDAGVREPSPPLSSALPDDLPLPGRSFWIQARYSL